MRDIEIRGVSSIEAFSVWLEDWEEVPRAEAVQMYCELHIPQLDTRYRALRHRRDRRLALVPTEPWQRALYAVEMRTADDWCVDLIAYLGEDGWSEERLDMWCRWRAVEKIETKDGYVLDLGVDDGEIHVAYDGSLKGVAA